MKIIATADLHGAFPEIAPCDLLIIAGDICPVDKSHEAWFQLNWLQDIFSPWLAEQPAKDIVWIAGNHDFGCELPEFKRVVNKFPGYYLMQDSVEIQGKKIYGMPWTPNLSTWAFYASDKAWSFLGEDIPSDADIVVLHSPPRGVMLDGAHPEWAAPYILTDLTQRVQPELCVFGHIHEGRGEIKLRGTQYANVAFMNEFYEPVNKPMEFELE